VSDRTIPEPTSRCRGRLGPAATLLLVAALHAPPARAGDVPGAPPRRPGHLQSQSPFDVGVSPVLPDEGLAMPPDLQESPGALPFTPKPTPEKLVALGGGVVDGLVGVAEAMLPEDGLEVLLLILGPLGAGPQAMKDALELYDFLRMGGHLEVLLACQTTAEALGRVWRGEGMPEDYDRLGQAVGPGVAGAIVALAAKRVSPRLMGIGRVKGEGAPALPGRGFNPPPGTRTRPPGVPDGWRIKPSRRSGGVRFVDPKNPHNSVRVMPGDPKSPYPNSQRPYVRWQRDGQALDGHGDPVPRTSPDAHIPLDDFEYSP